MMTPDQCRSLAARLRNPEHYVDACDEAADLIVKIPALLKHARKAALREAEKVTKDINDGYEWPVSRAILALIEKKEGE